MQSRDRFDRRALLKASAALGALPLINVRAALAEDTVGGADFFLTRRGQLHVALLDLIRLNE